MSVSLQSVRLEPTPVPHQAFPKWALVMVAAAGAFLFLYDAGHSYLSDEVWSLRAVKMPFAAMMTELRGDLHPPLYYLLLRIWRSLVGEGEFAIRLLSVTMCFGAGALVYATARETWGARAGLLSAAVFTVSPIAVTAGQMARMYGLLVMAAAASNYVFFRLLREERTRPVWWALYIAANIAGSFAQVWFFFFLFAQGVVFVAYHRGRKLGPMVLAAVASLAPYGVLWSPVLIHQVKISNATLVWIQPPVASDLLATVLYLGGVACLALPFLWVNRPKALSLPRLSWMVPAALFALTVLTPFLISLWKPLYGQRFAIVALPAFALLAGALTPRSLSLGLEGGMLAISCALAVAFGAHNQTACDSRVAAEYLSRQTSPDDLVIFTSMSRLPIDYYWNRLQPRRSVAERSFPAEIDSHPGFEGGIFAPAMIETLRAEAAEVAKLAESKGRVFLLHGVRPKTDELLKTRLDDKFAKADVPGISCEVVRGYFQYLTAYAGQAQETVAAVTADRVIETRAPIQRRSTGR